ncbi:FAD-dependent oxidoreductase [Kribbella sp. NPDC051952]|uniref:FAD-dependent oxidoreductase n=1 Tax=Kribbella sp. NPDC051952 TaxID=3154851 RepID=UPI0034332F88
MTAYLRSSADDPAEVGTPPAVGVTVDGVPVTARAGQTVAAVLLTENQPSWRTTRLAARPRGTFCGIGACHDCLVVVNGIPDIRACQRTIHPGDTITTQPGAVLPTAPPPTDEVPPRAGPAERVEGHLSSAKSRTVSSQPPRNAADVVVVGAGPAGIAAALAAADQGASVVLIDSGRALGGQFNRQLPVEFAARRPESLQHGWSGFAARRDRVTAHERITHLAESSVWAIEGLRLWVQRGPADAPGRDVFAVDAKAVVLATGAYDRVLPFPGWDLPGVYSAGAAQALAKGQRISVGKRVLVAGTGPFLLPVAESLVGVGAQVVGLLEANSLKTVRRGWSTDPLVAASKLPEAIGYAALLARHRIPLRHGWTVIAAHGTDHVEAVTVVRIDENWRPVPGTERRLEVDAVCLGFGFTAQLELAVSARCDLTTGPDGGPAVIVDHNQQTTTPGIYAAGELTGIGGADLSTQEGHLAGTQAAHHPQTTTNPVSGPATPPTNPVTGPAVPSTNPVGGSAAASRSADSVGDAAAPSPHSDGGVPSSFPLNPVRGVEEARAGVGKGRRFAAALAKAYPVRDGWKEWSGRETVVCRCEEVTRGDIEDAVVGRQLDDGRGLKLTTRAGLGMCQGRVCSRTVAALAAGQDDLRIPSMKRPIAVPIRLGDLAGAQAAPGDSTTEEEE